MEKNEKLRKNLGCSSFLNFDFIIFKLLNFVFFGGLI